MPSVEPGPLERYARARGRLVRDGAPSGSNRPPGRIKRILRRLLSARARATLRRRLTRLLAPYSRARASRLVRRGPIRLHLASGASPLGEWVNVDLVATGADLAWDLSGPLPLGDGSCCAVFSEHLLEHLELSDALALLGEVRRLLKPDGVIRLGVPDFRRYAEAYLGAGDLIERYRAGRPTPLLALSEVAYLHGHRSLWDAETLIAALEEVGFRDAVHRPFGDSVLSPAPDREHRRVETVYVEGTR